MTASKLPSHLIGLGLILTLIACSGTRAPTAGDALEPPSPPPAGNAADTGTVDEALEIEALLLLIGDRRVLEPIAVSRALESTEVHLRWRLALVLGQIGDARASGALSTLLVDPDPRVRRAAAFAIGRLTAVDANMEERLLRAVVDADRRTGIRAVEALARRGARIESVATGLTKLPASEILARLLPPLFRFRGPAVIRWAELGLESGDPALRRWAAYGLAREPQDAGIARLRELTGDADPWIAGWAARALGRIGDRSDVDRLAPLLDRPETGPVVQALRAARALIVRSAAAPPDAWRGRLLQLIEDPRPGVRITALEVAGVWLRDEALGSALVAKAESASTVHERLLALASLAEGADPRAESLVLAAATDPSPIVRRAAALAAGALAIPKTLASLAEDTDPGVRAAAVGQWLDLAQENASADGPVPRALEIGLRDPDPAPRATALDWLASHPDLGGANAGHDAIVAAMSHDDRLPDAWLAGIGALVARAEAMPNERRTTIETLESIARTSDYVVRRAASRAIADLGREAPPLGPATRRPVTFYREVVEQTREPFRLEMVTERGAVTLELDCRQAPIGCLSFVQLARQGFYDGLAFHRVVPDFVVQGGDPRGDGRGGPGFRVRSEPTLLRYGPGILGMARGAPDTAGSQFFITLSPQPHLDGDYTAFGRVTGGMDALDGLVQGDTIVSFRALP